MSEWINVVNKLPEFDGNYICYFSDGTIETFSYSIDDDRMWGVGIDVVTHWMPLPEPPK